MLVFILLSRVVLEDHCICWEMSRSMIDCVLLFQVVLDDNYTSCEILEVMIVFVLFIRIFRYIFLDSIIPKLVRYSFLDSSARGHFYGIIFWRSVKNVFTCCEVYKYVLVCVLLLFKVVL